MSVGDEGPYLNEDGDIWVPRTVPWERARGVAFEAIQEYGVYPKYVGKTEEILFGFTRDCWCEETCHMANEEADDYNPAMRDACRVPAWHFVQQERS